MSSNPMPDAPGLRKRPRRGVDAWYWVATAVSRQAGDYPLKTVRLHHATDAERAARCRELTQELREWLAERANPRPASFDGTMASLIRLYQEDEDSPYHKVRDNTRASYDHDLKLLSRGIGERQVAELTGKDFARWYDSFAAPKTDGAPRRVRRAHGLVTMLRILFGFGVTRRFTVCRDAAEILDEMRFETPRRRRVTMEFAHAQAIVDQALKDGLRSIALGQAMQFELAVRQIDAIGYWARVKGEGEGGIIFRGRRWTGGFTWSDLTGQMMTKETTKTGAEGQWDPTLCPLVVRAIAAFPKAEQVGPMIIDEATGRPYLAGRYARVWRKVATAAGVPAQVWNRDSRSGGLTEGGEAGAALGDLQQLGTHADPQTTARYIRRGIKATTRVQKLRVAARKTGAERS